MQKLWTNESFQPEVASAQTLDASWYLDPQVFEREQDAIFARTWQAVARTDELAKPGDYLTSEAAGEPIVLTRDQTGKLRAYYNVCPHRAGVVARGKGNRKSFQCLYHGWTFNHDGQLLRAPGMEETPSFDPACFSLHEIRTETWGPYVFINLDDDAPALAAMWGDEFTRVSGIRWDGWTLVERCEYLINCNWKVYLDNYAEGYHVPMAHPGLNREMNLDEYYVDTYRFFSIQWVPVKPANQGNPNKRRYVNPLPEDKIRYHVMFPNFMIDEYPDNLSVNIVRPQGHDKTLLTFEWYFKHDIDQAGIETMVKFADEVQYEDIEICEYVQQGLKSRSYNRGRFSARHENGVHHFQSLVHEYLNNDVIPLCREATPIK
ncbi:MAG: aromatic ring-hydroxylating dioxygenase subunit alpha [Chloroflexi bacterium]|uniref:aromatic ring-hydroxylating oxygenase subunit alpha n=1 Tax=Candidatus Flexifilum breve TaxID=3140694 RepID=UPI0031370619|nr:aromatic ring-hydroxylating dioxygenase subunit alpha [Chloroflexota bacterium]